MSDPLNPAAQAANLQAGRAKYKFTFAETDRQFEKDPKTVILRPITLGEEERASRRATEKKSLISYELLKESLYQADDTILTWDGSASREVFLDGCSPIVRDLMMKAFSSLHYAEKEASATFLATMEPIV